MPRASHPTGPDLGAVDDYLRELQQRIVAALESYEPSVRFIGQRLDSERASTRPMVLQSGDTFEKAAVMHTRVRDQSLPKSVSDRRPEIAGRPFSATSLSLITHPNNPFVPTVHMNLRCFNVHGAANLWHFGGGFDLTPSYGFACDAILWHKNAKKAVENVYPGEYEFMKRACDDYFSLRHRNEQRGIGGLFFDDWDKGGFAQSFALVCSVGDALLPGYLPIVSLRRNTPWNERNKRHQRRRRGRYAEFNLAIDRGTRYGLESGRRTESVLASLPPQADWEYEWRPDPGSLEAQLCSQFLTPRDWLAKHR